MVTRTKTPADDEVSESTKRAKKHLDRLQKSDGKRLIADLRAEAHGALKELIAHGYGATQTEVVSRALIAEKSRVVKKG